MDNILIVSLLISCFSITGAILNARKIIHGFYFWLISNTSWIIFNIYTKTYGQIPTWVVFQVVCIYGIIYWRNNN